MKQKERRRNNGNEGARAAQRRPGVVHAREPQRDERENKCESVEYLLFVFRELRHKARSM